MDFSYYEQHINKETIGRYDLTPLFENPEVFENLVKDLLQPIQKSYDKIIGLDALGFPIAGAISYKTKKPLVLIRKGGKLPGIPQTKTTVVFTDYSKQEKAFEMNKKSIQQGDKVLIVDEWMETGTQIRAAAKLVEERGGVVAAITLLGAEKTEQTKDLFEKYTIYAVKTF